MKGKKNNLRAVFSTGMAVFCCWAVFAGTVGITGCSGMNDSLNAEVSTDPVMQGELSGRDDGISQNDAAGSTDECGLNDTVGSTDETGLNDIDAASLDNMTAESMEDVLKEVLDLLPENDIVDAEEADFYKELYKREHGNVNTENISKEELLKFISGYHAEFYLAQYFDIREDATFAGVKNQWEEENTSRQEKKQKGEIFYGPVEYELTDYFEYIYSNLKLKNMEALVAVEDEALIAAAEAYYEENSETYDDLMGVTCHLSDGERSEEKVFTYDEIQSLQKTNEAVLNFIIEAEIGASMEYQNGDRTVTLTLISKEIDHREFEELQGVIMKDYVQREYYEGFIDEIVECLNIEVE